MKLIFRQMLFVLIAMLLSGVLSPQRASAQQQAVTEWTGSAHADATAAAFRHWDEDGEIPGRCAMCHAGAGLRSFYGFDGSEPGGTTAQPTGGVVDCDSCHVAGAASIAQVRFPSGVELAAPAGSAPCFTCHQGRQSGAGVAARLQGLAEDQVDPELSAINPHYKAAAATLHGAAAAGMYQYPGKTYAGRSPHAPEPLCTSCHNPHSLEVRVEDVCAACHQGDDPKAIRVSQVDYDGDGNSSEGIAGEIETLHAALGTAITAYARDTASAPITYVADRYPYYFLDGDGDGQASAAEAAYSNRYASWTPRLLRASYNYMYIAKEPGAYAHNPQYALQVLIDTIEDLTGETPENAVRP